MLARCSGLFMNARCTLGMSPAMPTFSPSTVQLLTWLAKAPLCESAFTAARCCAHRCATAFSSAFSCSAGSPAPARAWLVAAARSPDGLANAGVAAAVVVANAPMTIDAATTNFPTRRWPRRRTCPDPAMRKRTSAGLSLGCRRDRRSVRLCSNGNWLGAKREVLEQEMRTNRTPLSAFHSPGVTVN